MITKPYILHALSPLHAGTGQSVDVIDLPIARMRATGIPFVPGSSIKGVLREAHQDNATKQAIFGPETGNASDHASAIIIGDARLLFLPVRSFKGVFAWVTCPLWLSLAQRDLAGQSNLPPQIPSLVSTGAKVGSVEGHLNIKDNKVYLEDLDLPVQEEKCLVEWANFFAGVIAPQNQEKMFINRFVVVDDDTASFLSETATQVDTRVRLDPETRVVVDGALWMEESLPPESVLIGVIAAEPSRNAKIKLSAEDVMKKALPTQENLQFGGKATVGRGRCRFIRLD